MRWHMRLVVVTTAALGAAGCFAHQQKAPWGGAGYEISDAGNGTFFIEVEAGIWETHADVMESLHARAAEVCLSRRFDDFEIIDEQRGSATRGSGKSVTSKAQASAYVRCKLSEARIAESKRRARQQLVAARPAGRLTTHSDRFKKERVLMWKDVPVLLDDRSLMTIEVRVKVEQPAGPIAPADQVFQLSLAPEADHARRYADCHSLDLLVDDQPVEVAGTIYESPRVKAQLERDVVARIAAASKVEGRLCRNTFLLSAEQLNHLRKLVASTDPAEAAVQPAVASPSPEGAR